MVVVSRSQLNRIRRMSWLTIALGIAAIAWSVSNAPGGGANLAVSVAVAAVAVAAMWNAVLQLISQPRRTRVLLVHRETDMIIATDSLEDGLMLRFLRDVLTDQCAALSDEDRERMKPLEANGFIPHLYIRQPRKVLIMRYCYLMFDDVLTVDLADRWDHFKSSDTAEPTFSDRVTSPLPSWRNEVRPGA